jgi:hypothetical protein
VQVEVIIIIVPEQRHGHITVAAPSFVDSWTNNSACLDNTKDRNTAMISWKTTKSFCGILGILVQGPYAGAFNPLEAIAHQYLTSILTVCILPLLFWKITK